MKNGNNALNRVKFSMLIVAAVVIGFVAQHSPSDGATLGISQSGWNAPAEAKAKENPLKGDSQAAERGKKLFADNCAMCHGPAGKGDGPLSANLKPKPADLTKRIKDQTDGELFWKISKGKLPMPSYEKSIPKDNDRWAIVAYIRTL